MKNKRFGRIRQPDGQKIVLKLHYHRSDGNYQDWNAWIWTTAVAGKSYPLREEDGVMTATFTVDSRYTTAIRFILRKGEWAAQEFGQRHRPLLCGVRGGGWPDGPEPGQRDHQ